MKRISCWQNIFKADTEIHHNDLNKPDNVTLQIMRRGEIIRYFSRTVINVAIFMKHQEKRDDRNILKLHRQRALGNHKIKQTIINIQMTYTVYGSVKHSTYTS